METSDAVDRRVQTGPPVIAVGGEYDVQRGRDGTLRRARVLAIRPKQRDVSERPHSESPSRSSGSISQPIRQDVTSRKISTVREIYVHYVGLDHRLDEWIDEETASPISQPNGGEFEADEKVEETEGIGSTDLPPRKRRRISPDTSEVPPNPKVDLSKTNLRLASDGLPPSQSNPRRIELVIFGNYEIRAWYESPYPLDEVETGPSSTKGGPADTPNTSEQLGLRRSSSASQLLTRLSQPPISKTAPRKSTSSIRSPSKGMRDEHGRFLRKDGLQSESGPPLRGDGGRFLAKGTQEYSDAFEAWIQTEGAGDAGQMPFAGDVPGPPKPPKPKLQKGPSGAPIFKGKEIATADTPASRTRRRSSRGNPEEPPIRDSATAGQSDSMLPSLPAESGSLQAIPVSSRDPHLSIASSADDPPGEDNPRESSGHGQAGDPTAVLPASRVVPNATNGQEERPLQTPSAAKRTRQEAESSSLEPIRERGKRGRFIKRKDQVGEFRSDSTSDIPTDDRASPPVRAMVQANKLPTAGDVEIAMQMIEDTLTPDGHSSANDANNKPHNAELVPIAKGNGRANEVQSNINSTPKDAVSARDSGQPSATSIVRTTKRLYVCDGCFKYMKQPAIYNSHKKRCTYTHPPGRKVYQKGAHTIWEVDGADAKLYAQCLCLFGKLFIDHKYIFFDVEGFTFYVLTDARPSFDHVLGFFSKEKVSYDDYNLACIVTFPPYQKKGFGTLLIEFSYELSRRNQVAIAGTPERPLSDLGLRGYLAFWTAVLVRYFRLVFALRGQAQEIPNAALSPGPPMGTMEGDNDSTQEKQIRRARSFKGWEGELPVVTRSSPSNSDPKGQSSSKSSIRTRSSLAANSNGISLPSRPFTLRITLADIVRATFLRMDDAAFALQESGLAQFRRPTNSDERAVEVDASGWLDGIEFVVTPRLVEEVARRRKVKIAIMNPAHVLL